MAKLIASSIVVDIVPSETIAVRIIKLAAQLI
jgi:hypothetical protein